MPARIIVHFGTPKTGTTSIQTALATHLHDERFAYVTLDAKNLNRDVIVAFSSDPDKYGVIKRLGLTPVARERMKQDILERLSARLADVGDRTAVLSSESLYGMDVDELRRLFDLLGRHSSRIEAVGYFRHPKAYMESLFQQNLKAASDASFELSRYFPHYQAHVGRFESILGAENVQCWLFDPKRLRDHCVVKDFFGRIGIRASNQTYPRENSSMSRNAASLMYIYRVYASSFREGPLDEVSNSRLVNRLLGLPGPRFRFHSDVVHAQMAKNSGTMAWFRRRFGADDAAALAGDDAAAVRSIDELLEPSADSLRWLARLTGKDPAAAHKHPADLIEVARDLDFLRLRLVEKAAKAASK